MGVSISMIALGADPKISLEAIRDDLKANWSHLSEATELKEDDGTFALRVGESDIILGLMPGPIPWGDLDGPCATSRLWPTAAQELKEHKTYLIVTVSDESTPLQRAVLLTQATASIVGTCPEAIGVYWCPASLVVKAAMFRDFAIKVLEHGPPLHIWVDFRVGRNEQGATSGFTKGLVELGLLEIEAENSPEPPGELHDRLMRMAEYLLDQGPVIRDGDTVGDDENQRIRVVYAKPKFDNGEQVMRLEYDTKSLPDAKPSPKPRWKFW